MTAFPTGAATLALALAAAALGTAHGLCLTATSSWVSTEPDAVKRLRFPGLDPAKISIEVAQQPSDQFKVILTYTNDVVGGTFEFNDGVASFVFKEATPEPEEPIESGGTRANSLAGLSTIVAASALADRHPHAAALVATLGAVTCVNGQDGCDYKSAMFHVKIPEHICYLRADGSDLVFGSCAQSIQQARLAAVGEEVLVSGVVTADMRATARKGFFLQDPASTANDETVSEGIFVYCGNTCDSANFQPGQTIILQGKRSVYNNVVQLSTSFERFKVTCNTPSVVVNAATGFEACAELNIPEMTLPLSTKEDFRRFDSMIVSVASEMTITDVYTLRYGTIGLSAGGRLFSETQRVPPGDAVAGAILENNLRFLALDDGSSDSCVAGLKYPVGGPNSLRIGNTVNKTVLEGTSVLHLDSGTWTLLPINEDAYAHIAAAGFKHDKNRREKLHPLIPRSAGKTLRVASMNLNNYFTDLGINQDQDPVNGNCTVCGGAEDWEEFVRQREKLFAAIKALDAAIFGLQQIQNDDSRTLENFVNELNTQLGIVDKYDFVKASPDASKYTVTNAIIYKRSLLRPRGNADWLDFASVTDGLGLAYLADFPSPTLFQRFQFPSGEKAFTFVVNHFVSRTSTCSEDIKPYPNRLEGEGNCGHIRLKQAERLQKEIRVEYRNERLLMVGNFNSYSKERSIAYLDTSNVNLADSIDDAYSYNVGGKSGTLDYIFTSSDFTCTDTAFWRINSDESDFLGYEHHPYPDCNRTTTGTESYFRSSDHDPVISLCTFPLEA